MNSTLDGKVAVVIGAGSGIGAEPFQGRGQAQSLGPGGVQDGW